MDGATIPETGARGMAHRATFEAATAKQQSLQPAAWAAPEPCVIPVP
jgi:hypothetical protein